MIFLKSQHGLIYNYKDGNGLWGLELLSYFAQAWIYNPSIFV